MANMGLTQADRNEMLRLREIFYEDWSIVVGAHDVIYLKRITIYPYDSPLYSSQKTIEVWSGAELRKIVRKLPRYPHLKECTVYLPEDAKKHGAFKLFAFMQEQSYEKDFRLMAFSCVKPTADMIEQFNAEAQELKDAA